MAKKIYLLIFLSLLLPLALFLLSRKTKLQNLAINSDQTISLNFTQPVYSFSINGRVDLLDQNLSFLRIILVDDQQNEYLVYEISPLLTNQKSFFVSNQCDETCFLDGIIPKQLKIEGNQYSFLMANYQTTAKIPKLTLFRQQIKQQKDEIKISQLNKQIKQKNLTWIAGETPISSLTYAQKKKLFSTPDGKPVDKLPNLQGFEYYKSGVFDIQTDDNLSPAPTVPPYLPLSWDWRNVNGESWVTPVKNQGLSATCWSFATIALMESTIDLYYNQHLNLDLSEQFFISCGAVHFGRLGSVDETCFSYTGYAVSCDSVCPDWNTRYWSSHDTNRDMQEIPITSSYELRRLIIKNGPAYVHYAPLNHAMLIVSYKTDPDARLDYFTVKNSWGTRWGEEGFGKISSRGVFSSASKSGFYILKPPISPSQNSLSEASIKCVDNDQDHYCNWGISETKPLTCPFFCQNQKDCDDSNPTIGPFDPDYQNCLLVTPTPIRSLKPPKNLPTLPPGGVWR